MSTVLKIGDEQFAEEVLKSNTLTIVDFGATWCGPCQKLHPIMAELANEYNDKVKIVEVDVDKATNTAIQFGITSVPQLLFFKNGIVKETVVGLLSKSKIEEKIDRLLKD